MRPERVRIRLLGGTVVERGGNPLAGSAAHRHPLALLAILAAERATPVTRDKLVALLWPEAGEQEARKRLRVCLHALREILGRGALRSVGDALQLDFDAVDLDVSGFEGAVATGDYATASRLYGGPFMDGFHLADSGEFDDWMERQRDRLGRLHDDALEGFATEVEAEGDPARAVQIWRARAARDPYSGRVTLRLMEALERVGDRAAALRHGLDHQRRMREEFDAEPDPAIDALLNRMRLRPSPDPPQTPAAAAAPASAHDEAATASRLPARLRPERASRPRPSRRGSAAIAMAAAVFVLLGAGYLGTRFLDRPGAHEGGTGEGGAPPPLVLTDFRGFTGDSLLPRAITEALRVDIAQSPTVSLVRPPELKETLALMRRPDSTGLDPEAARQVAQRLGLPGVIEGEVMRAGDGYILTARLVTPDSARVIAAFRETASDSTVLVEAVERLSHAIRTQGGESARSLRSSPPLEKMTTASVPALRKWASAVNGHLFLGMEGDETMRLLEEATALDPDFGAAWRWLAILYTNGNRPGPAYRAIQRAISVEDRLPTPQLAFTRILYDRVAGNLAAAEAGFLAMDPPQWSNASDIAWMQGHFRDAELYAREALESPRAGGARRHYILFWNLAIAQLELGKVVEARATADSSRESGNPTVDQDLHFLADFVEGRYEEASRRTPTSLGAKYRLALLHGRLGEARQETAELSERRAIARRQQAAVEHALSELLIVGHIEALERADALVQEGLAPEFDEQLIAELAVAQALIGDLGAAGRARAVYEERILPEIRWNDDHLLHLHDGLVDLNEGRRDEALMAFRRARASTPWPNPVDAVLGQAYEQIGLPDSAVAAYTRYIETPWAYRPGLHSWFSDIRVLVPIHERLAILYAERGDFERARRHAAQVVRLWSDADPELQPRVARARTLLADAPTPRLR